MIHTPPEVQFSLILNRQIICTANAQKDNPTNTRTVLSMQLADAPVLGLPGEEIQQRTQRLADEAEADPEHRVSEDLAAARLHPLQGCGGVYEGQLEHHSRKRDAYAMLG